MSDDDTNICGHPTQGGDGPPCQHPAGEDGSCHIPAHGGDGDAGGREFVIDQSDHTSILEAARKGVSKAGCARAAGTKKQNLQRYLEADENSDFRDAFMRARSKGEQRLVMGPLFDPVDTGEPAQVQGPEEQMNGQHARFLLSTSFDYKKTEKKEVTGEGGGPVKVEMNETVVETGWSDEQHTDG